MGGGSIIFNSMRGEGFNEMVISEQTPEEGKKKHAGIWGRSLPGRGPQTTRRAVWLGPRKQEGDAKWNHRERNDSHPPFS